MKRTNRGATSRDDSSAFKASAKPAQAREANIINRVYRFTGSRATLLDLRKLNDFKIRLDGNNSPRNDQSLALCGQLFLAERSLFFMEPAD